jgi:uncharacterized membrane protein
VKGPITFIHKVRMLHNLLGDERGVVAPMIAALGVVLLAATGLVLDVGLYYSGNRSLKVATEAAALAAATGAYQGQAVAEARARDYFVRNGYADTSILKQVEVGYYCANISPALVSTTGSRFFPQGGGLPADCAGSVPRTWNAVRVTTSTKSRQFLSSIFGKASPIPQLAATASAARIDEAGISATSGLLDISNPLVVTVNNLLGQLLNVKLTLSTNDIESLLSGNVDAGLFFDALAKKADFTGTYGNLVLGSYQLKDIASAAASAAGSSATKLALEKFALQAPSNYSVPLKGLFSVGVWRNMQVGGADVAPALRAGLNSYQLISYAVQDGPVVVDIGKAVQPLLPKNMLTGAEVKIGLAVSGHVNRPRFAFGPAGEAKVGTSMIRLKVDVTLADLPLGVAKANVPILLDVASAEADISSSDGIACAGQANQAGNTTVRLNVTSALVKAYIGDYYVNNVKTDPLIKPLPPISASNIRQTSIVDVISLKPLGLPLALPTVLSVKGKAVVEPVFGSGQGATLTFGPGLVGSPTTPGTGLAMPNGAKIGTTVDGLVNSLTGGDGKDAGIQLYLLDGVPLLDIFGVKSQLLPAITKPLTGVVTAIVDPLLDTVLITLGIQLGHEKAWVNGVRCGVPVLI